MFSCALTFQLLSVFLLVLKYMFLDSLSPVLTKERSVYLADENIHKMVIDHDSGENCYFHGVLVHCSNAS
jgi:hypothetical protein